MEEEVVENPTRVYRHIIPCRLDHMVYIELQNRTSALISREGVPCAHVREIIQNLHLFTYGTHLLVK